MVDPLSGLSIIVPVFNERESVLATLKAIRGVIVPLGISFEIIAVDDGSTDGSSELLDSSLPTEVVVLHHSKNRGYGASLKSGIRTARYEWILITDADGTYPAERIPDLITAAAHADMVVGSRTGASVHSTIARAVGRGIIRRFASYVANFSIPDINSGMRLFRKIDAERFWHLFPDGFSFTTTITVASHVSGNRVEYIPINYLKRVGVSSIKPAKDFIGFLSLIARLALYFKPLKVFVPTSIALFVLAISILIGSWLWLPHILDSTFAILATAALQTLFFGLIAEMIVRRFYGR